MDVAGAAADAAGLVGGPRPRSGRRTGRPSRSSRHRSRASQALNVGYRRFSRAATIVLDSASKTKSRSPSVQAIRPSVRSTKKLDPTGLAISPWNSPSSVTRPEVSTSRNRAVQQPDDRRRRAPAPSSPRRRAGRRRRRRAGSRCRSGCCPASTTRRRRTGGRTRGTESVTSPARPGAAVRRRRGSPGKPIATAAATSTVAPTTGERSPAAAGSALDDLGDRCRPDLDRVGEPAEVLTDLLLVHESSRMTRSSIAASARDVRLFTVPTETPRTCGDLRLAEVADELEHQHLAVVPAQRRQRLVDDSAVEHSAVGVGERVGEVLGRDLAPPPAPPALRPRVEDGPEDVGVGVSGRGGRGTTSGSRR